MRFNVYLLLAYILFTYSTAQAASMCGDKGVWLQVLGSGGPELDDQRASSAYLIWLDGKARLLVDMGAGSLLRFEQSAANLNDIDVILLSHLHVDHSADLPAFLKASYFTNREYDLRVYGPEGNHFMPSLADFVQRLFSTDGAFRYLNDYLDGTESYRLIPANVIASGKKSQQVLQNSRYNITAIPVQHGPVPAIAWRVEIAGYRLVFSGDMNNQNNTLASLAEQADILVAHHAIAENAGKIARTLHMPPSVIGQIAAQAKVKQLVLSHRMNRTSGQEENSTALIRQAYHGQLYFADDLQCFRPGSSITVIE